MALKPGLRLKQTRRLSLTPSLRQSIEVLRLSSIELDALIVAELEENPLLTREKDYPFLPAHDLSPSLAAMAQPTSLTKHLQNQIALISTQSGIRQIADFLAASLDERGFLSETESDFADFLGVDRQDISTAIDILQSCEPLGIGARDLKECLALQLDAKGVDAASKHIIVENLSLFASQDWRALSKLTGMKTADLKRLAETLKGLNPYPGQVAEPVRSVSLRPDIIVRLQKDGVLSAELIGSSAASLTVDHALKSSATASEPGAGPFLLAKAEAANGLIRAIEARSKTILRVVHAILLYQSRFFLSGHGFLRPLTQKEIAASLGLHPSTVARAIVGKALSCSLGVFPLKFFFTTSLSSLTKEQSSSAYVVQQEIRRMTNEETHANILSDAQIAAYLQRSGVDIARRTVAKYRQCLKIPSSIERRRSKKPL